MRHERGIHSTQRLDIGLFVLFFAIVIGASMYKSRLEETGEDFFLASRGLVWPLIGLSLIAANISTEHFVGIAGQGAGLAGLAVASYEWMAAITLVVVAFFFLPKLLSSGIYTIPEFLEYRYNAAARGIMALQLYRPELTGAGGTTDAAYPLLIRNLIAPGVRGFIFAAISGAVISSLASMLNSTSTIFTIELYKRHLKKAASEHGLVTMGRITTPVFVVAGFLIAPQLANPKFKGIFNYIQEF